MAEREKKLTICPKCGEKMYSMMTWFSGEIRKQRVECINKHKLTLDITTEINQRSLRNLMASNS